MDRLRPLWRLVCLQMWSLASVPCKHAVWLEFQVAILQAKSPGFNHGVGIATKMWTTSSLASGEAARHRKASPMQRREEEREELHNWQKVLAPKVPKKSCPDEEV